MITDNINNAYKYYYLSPAIKQGLEFLSSNNLKSFEPAKYLLDKENIYVNIEEYTTRTSSNIEAHREYIDIQFIITGEENIGVCNLDNLTPVSEYNQEKDIVFYNGKITLNHIKQSEFMILFPEDAHLPCQMVDNNPSSVKKAVVKIKILQ